MTNKEKLTLQEMTGRDENGLIEKEETSQSTSDIIAITAVKELLNPDKIKTNSRIDKAQIKTIAKLFLFGSVYDSNFASDLGRLILELQVSLNGLGRQELVQLVQQRSETIFTEETQKKGIFK